MDKGRYLKTFVQESTKDMVTDVRVRGIIRTRYVKKDSAHITFQISFSAAWRHQLLIW